MIILRKETLVALTVVVVLPVVLPSASLATEILIFAMASLACNLLLGYAGLLSFGQGILFGTGAYVGAIAMMRGSVGLLGGMAAAIVAGAIIAAAVGALAIRRTGIYFVMLTLAFAQMAYFAAYTLQGWTGGDNGLLDVPRPPLAFFGVDLVSLADPRLYYGFVAILYVLVFMGAQRVIRSPFGSTLRAIGENEERAIAVGYNTRHFKILAFVLSGAVTGLAGVLYAMQLNFAPLGNIDLSMSESIVIMTVIGGTGSLLGSLLGAGSITLLGDLLSPHWPRWLMALGALLILVVVFARGGLWGGLDALVERWINRRGNGR